MTPRPSGRAGGGRAQGPRSTTEGPQLFEKLITVNRVAKTHKGGRRMSFSALTVVGDGKGRVGMHLGKSTEAGEAIRKGFIHAERNMVSIPLKGGTIHHEIIGHYGAATVLLKPASPGTGIVGGGAVRAVCEACGVTDILTKCLGSTNPINVIKATLAGLRSIESVELIQQRRRLVVEVDAET